MTKWYMQGGPKSKRISRVTIKLYENWQWN